MWLSGAHFLVDHFLDVYMPELDLWVEGVVAEARHVPNPAIRVRYKHQSEVRDAWVELPTDRIAQYESRRRQECALPRTKTSFWNGKSRNAALPRPATSHTGAGSRAARPTTTDGSGGVTGAGDDALTGLDRSPPGGEGQGGLGDIDPRVMAYVRALYARGLTVHPMGGDGNCLFRSVADQVYGSQDAHGVVRAAAAGYMRANAGFFQSFVVGEDAAGFLTYCDDIAR